MKKLSLILAISTLIALQMVAQTPRFQKYQINETGYYAYFPGDPGKFDVAQSQDSLLIYTKEIEIQGNKYGLIMVFFGDKFTKSPKEELSALLESYMDYLKNSFEIKNAAGYGKGHTMDSNPQAQGIIDFWESAAGLQYAVKGWIDKSALGFLYIAGKEEINYNYKELIFNGFRFK